MNIADHFSGLTWEQSTIQVEIKQSGFGPKIKPVVWPCMIGTSSDGYTAIQLIGSPDNIRGITLMASMPPDDIETIKRNGAYAALCLAAVAPTWKQRDAWLSTTMRRIRTVKEVVTKHGAWRIGAKFIPETSVFILKAIL